MNLDSLKKWRSAYDDIQVKGQIKQVKWKLKKLSSGRRV